MKHIGINRLYYLLLALLLLAANGCGTSGSSSSTAAGDTGAVSAKLVWSDKSTGKTLAAVPPGSDVTTVKMTVSGTGTNGGAIPVVRTSFNAITSNSGTVSGVYPGTVTLTALALNNAGVVRFEGAALNLVVAANATTDAGTINLTPPLLKAQDASCTSCHETYLDNSTQNLVANFKQSGHYSNDSWSTNPKYGITGTGCAGCHGPQHNDTNPSASGRCFECHGAALSLRHTAPGVPLSNARYLSLGNNNCSACHEPHNPINGAGKQERKDWADSGHGDVNALAWMDYDFTTRATCNACHTPTGFVQAIGSNWTNTAVIPGTAMQPLTCDGCHSSDDFANSVRAIPGAYKAGMGGFGTSAKAFIQFPDVGESNLCIPCHASRENGASLVAGNYNFTNKTFVNPHYLAAAATLYGTGGFQFYTSGVRYNTYGAAGRVGKNANWSHGRVGMENYSASGNNDVSGKSNNTGNKGQCVACHLGPENTHTFGALEVANESMAGAAGGYTRGCYGCHKGSDMDMAAFIDEEKEIWQRLFDFLEWNFANNPDGTTRTNPLYFDNLVYPYFFTDAGLTNSATNWTLTVPGGSGLQTMGAGMNLKLLVAERGSFVHNRAFGRALIADSIVYLQKGAVGDRSVAVPDPNMIMTFTGYSTARPTSYPGQVGPNISISTVKSYLTRTSGGLYTRR